MTDGDRQVGFNISLICAQKQQPRDLLSEHDHVHYDCHPRPFLYNSMGSLQQQKTEDEGMEHYWETPSQPSPKKPKHFLLQSIAMLAPSAKLMLNRSKKQIILAGFELLLMPSSISYLFKLLLELFTSNLKFDCPNKYRKRHKDLVCKIQSLYGLGTFPMLHSLWSHFHGW